MSETPNNNNEDLFEMSPSQDAPHPAEESISPVESDWVTVNFPDAIGVDDIPRDPEPPQTSIRIQELEQQNHQLLARVSELEAALTQSQTLLKTETERLERLAGAQFAEAEIRAQKDAQLAQQQAALIAKQRHALDAAKQRLHEQEAELEQRSLALNHAQDQIKQLAHDLDLGHQAHQKQQILVETLTGQLQASQEQVAQLERECALIKQRYDEQVQLTRQAESSCKDLRSRLNRQQQYTLQFKAALEKCLDVPAAQVSIAAETAQRAVDAEELCSVSPTSFIKAQPVQPWSATPGFPAVLPEPEVHQPWAVEPSVSEEFNVEETEEPEAEFVAEPIVETLSDLPEATVWREPVEPEPSVAPKPLSYTIKRSPVEAFNQSEAANRIQLFSPSSVEAQPELTAETPIVEVESFVTQSSVESTVIQPEEMPQDIAVQAEETPTIDLSHNPWSNAFESEAEVFVVTEETPQFDTVEVETPEPQDFAPSNSPFITLTSNAVRPAQPIEAEAGEAPENSPSPVVYPARSQKKLSSLAAVDLPSFPRPANK